MSAPNAAPNAALLPLCEKLKIEAKDLSDCTQLIGSLGSFFSRDFDPAYARSSNLCLLPVMLKNDEIQYFVPVSSCELSVSHVSSVLSTIRSLFPEPLASPYMDYYTKLSSQDTDPENILGKFMLNFQRIYKRLLTTRTVQVIQDYAKNESTVDTVLREVLSDMELAHATNETIDDRTFYLDYAYIALFAMLPCATVITQSLYNWITVQANVIDGLVRAKMFDAKLIPLAALQHILIPMRAGGETPLVKVLWKLFNDFVKEAPNLEHSFQSVFLNTIKVLMNVAFNNIAVVQDYRQNLTILCVQYRQVYLPPDLARSVMEQSQRMWHASHAQQPQVAAPTYLSFVPVPEQATQSPVVETPVVETPVSQNQVTIPMVPSPDALTSSLGAESTHSNLTIRDDDEKEILEHMKYTHERVCQADALMQKSIEDLQGGYVDECKDKLQEFMANPHTLDCYLATCQLTKIQRKSLKKLNGKAKLEMKLSIAMDFYQQEIAMVDKHYMQEEASTNLYDYLPDNTCSKPSTSGFNVHAPAFVPTMQLQQPTMSQIFNQPLVFDQRSPSPIPDATTDNAKTADLSSWVQTTQWHDIEVPVDETEYPKFDPSVKQPKAKVYIPVAQETQQEETLGVFYTDCNGMEHMQEYRSDKDINASVGVRKRLCFTLRESIRQYPSSSNCYLSYCKMWAIIQKSEYLYLRNPERDVGNINYANSDYAKYFDASH